MRPSLIALLWGLWFVFASVAGNVQANEINAKKLLSQPKSYVGSDVCKNCHLEHYDAWKRTLHSRMLQDAKANKDVIVTKIDPKVIREDLKKIEKKAEGSSGSSVHS